jgi:flagellar protein FlaG
MDMLNVVSSPPYPGSAPATTSPSSGEPVSVTAAASTTAEPVKAVATPELVKLPGQSEPEKKQQIANAVNDINHFFQMAQRSLGFTLDESTGKMLMQITDSETHEVIRQIPGDDVLKLASHLDNLTGVLFKAQA